MTAILITGGAGFIGSCMVRQLLAEELGIQIVNLDRLTYAGNFDSLGFAARDPRHRLVLGDVCDPDLLVQLFQKYRPEAVLHFAAETHVDRSIDKPVNFLQTNVMGTFNLLEASRNYWRTLSKAERQTFRFLHVSTDEVYGSLASAGLFTESTPYAPNSPYAASKASSDHFVRAFYHTYGLPTLITHCSNNYGPFQFPEKLVPLMILNALEGRDLPIYGDGLQVRDWLFVEDHCRALRLVLAKGQPGEVYNIGGSSEHTNVDIVRRICRLIDSFRPDLVHRPCDQLIRYVEDRPGHDRRYALDTGKIQRELGWQPAQSLEAGLAETVMWYLGNAGWIERVANGSYRRERLGLPARIDGFVE